MGVEVRIWIDEIEVGMRLAIEVVLISQNPDKWATYLGALSLAWLATAVILYVSGFLSDNIVRYDGTTGAVLQVFASGSGLNGPRGFVYDVVRGLYAANFNQDSVLRYASGTGAFVETFVSMGGGGVDGPVGIAFEPPYFIGDFEPGDVSQWDQVTPAPML